MRAETSDESGPVLFAYDGSELAGHAITEAGRQLRAGRDAVVLTIWEPFNVGFLPVDGAGFDAAGADEVKAAAEKTASHGASLAEAAGFHAETMTAEGAPTWKGVIDAAESRDASPHRSRLPRPQRRDESCHRQRRQRRHRALTAVGAGRAPSPQLAEACLRHGGAS